MHHIMEEKRLLVFNSSFWRQHILFAALALFSYSAVFSQTNELQGSWHSEYSILMKDNALFSSTTFTVTHDSIHVKFQRRTTDSTDIFFGSIIPGKKLTILQSAKINKFHTFDSTKGAILFALQDTMFSGTLAILYEKITNDRYRFFLDGKIVEDEKNLSSLANFSSHNLLLMTKDSTFYREMKLPTVAPILTIRDFQKVQQRLVPLLKSEDAKKRAELSTNDGSELLTNIYIVIESLQEVFRKDKKNPYESNHRFFQFLINEVIKDYTKKVASKSTSKNKVERENLKYKIETLESFIQQGNQ